MSIPSGTTDRLVYFVGVDATDLKTRETGLTTFTVVYSIAGGADATMTTPTVAEIDSTTMPGVYSLLIDESGMTTLTAGHDTAELVLHITQASMAPVTRVIDIYRVKMTEGQAATVANSAIDADIERLQGSAIATPSVAGVLEVDVTHWIGTAAATPTTAGVPEVDVTHWRGGAVPAVSVTGVPEVDITHVNGAAQTATLDTIKAETAVIVVDTTTDIPALIDALPTAAENADAVWDEDATGHQTGGTFGQAIGDPAADTNTIFGAVVTGAAGATIAADIVDIEGKVDDLESRLGTPSDLGGGATVAANLADIEAQTDDIGVAGAGLTDLGGMSTGMKAEVNAEVVDVLNTDTFAEPGQGTPGATISLAAKIGYLFKAWRNRHTQTSSEYALYADDATTKDQEAVVSDDGTTFERGEVATGA